MELVERLRTDGIHGVYKPDLNAELSFLFMLGEKHGQPIKEATGMTRWISDCEEQMGFKETVKPSMAKRVVRAAIDTFNPRMNSTSRQAGRGLVDGQMQQLHYLQELQCYNSNPADYNAMVRNTQRSKKHKGLDLVVLMVSKGNKT